MFQQDLNLCLQRAEDYAEHSTSGEAGIASLKPCGTSLLVGGSVLSLWVLTADTVVNCPYSVASWGGEPGGLTLWDSL